MGIGASPDQTRIAVRRAQNGQPLVRLHRRTGLFYQTVAIFDNHEQRVGYCRSGFKGTGARSDFAILRADHSQVGAVSRTGNGNYRLTRAGGERWAGVVVPRREAAPVCRVHRNESGNEEPDGNFLLAAAVVLYQPGSGSRG